MCNDKKSFGVKFSRIRKIHLSITCSYKFVGPHLVYEIVLKLYFRSIRKSAWKLLVISTFGQVLKAMSTVEERTAYLDNPFFEKHVYGDFTSFYITIAVCTVFGIFLFAVNLICGCCSRHRGYWNDRFTGLMTHLCCGIYDAN